MGMSGTSFLADVRLGPNGQMILCACGSHPLRAETPGTPIDKVTFHDNTTGRRGTPICSTAPGFVAR